ncbi:MAG: hypothetical protein JOZ60_00630 [Verrucomicrobia bacterium]|nr:hypothetical protein [Verrucomicrobiota bacterium]
MSFNRCFFSHPRLRLALALIALSTLSAQADDTWHNIYHSLKKFFVGKPSPTPIAHHRVRRSQKPEKTSPSTEPAESPVLGSSSHGASAAPRVVVLPAISPTAEANSAAVNPGPGVVNSAQTPEAVKPTPSPELGPVLRSLTEPTPGSSPGVVPSAAPGAGKTTAN